MWVELRRQIGLCHVAVSGSHRREEADSERKSERKARPPRYLGGYGSTG